MVNGSVAQFGKYVFEKAVVFCLANSLPILLNPADEGEQKKKIKVQQHNRFMECESSISHFPAWTVIYGSYVRSTSPPLNIL